MSKILVAGALGAAVLGAGGYVVGERYAQSRLEAGIAEVRSKIGPGGSLTFASAEASFLRGSATLRNIEIRNGDAVARVDEVVVSGFSGTRGSASWRNLRMQVPGATASAATGSFENLLVPGGSGPHQAIMSQFDSLRFGEMKINADGKETTASAFSLTGYGPGRSSSLSLSNFSTPASGHPGLDRVSAGALSIAGVDLFSLASGIIAQEAGRGPAWPTGTSSFEARDLAAYRRGEPVATLGRAVVSADRSATGATSFSIALNDSWGRLTPEVRAQVASLGYEDIRSDVSIGASHDPATRRLAIGPVSLRGQNMFEISLRIEMSSVPDLTAGQPGTNELLAMELVSASVRYVDLSLAERALAAAAKESGMSVEAVRLHASQFVGSSSGRGPQTAAERSIREAIVRFVAKPGEIEFTAKPERPVTLGEIAAASSSPERLVDRLRVTATAK